MGRMLDRKFLDEGWVGSFLKWVKSVEVQSQDRDAQI